MEAARLRLRPILMTAFAFILGVVPLMLATGAGAASRQSIGTTVFGGMLAATILTLVFVPVFYAVDRALRERRASPRRRRPRRPTPHGAAARAGGMIRRSPMRIWKLTPRPRRRRRRRRPRHPASAIARALAAARPPARRRPAASPRHAGHAGARRARREAAALPITLDYSGAHRGRVRNVTLQAKVAGLPAGAARRPTAPT